MASVETDYQQQQLDKTELVSRLFELQGIKDLYLFLEDQNAAKSRQPRQRGGLNQGRESLRDLKRNYQFIDSIPWPNWPGIKVKSMPSNKYQELNSMVSSDRHALDIELMYILLV